MGIYCDGIKIFFSRYVRYFYKVWKIRSELTPAVRNKDEYEFLPAHLELIEKPISPLPKWTSRIIILLIIITILWSILGKVDIVSVASGKLAYSGKSKTIQPIETAMVKKIFVQEGQKVEQGQILLELTALGAKEDQEKSRQSLQLALLAQARARALLKAIEQDKLPELTLPEEIPQDNRDVLQAQQLINEQFNAYRSQKRQMEAQFNQKQAQLNSIQAQITKYENLSKVETERFKDLHSLYKIKAISKHEYFTQEMKLNEANNELNSQRSHLKEIEASIEQTREENDLLSYTFKRDTQEALRQANEQVENLKFELEKTSQRYGTTEIKSPVTGTVQQLSIHTIGGVVTAAQPLMVVVPQEDKLEVNALISNKDVGFVRPGQKVVIKLEAFPYTRYGYITGIVKSISFDAIENDKLGLVFSAIVEMDKDYLIYEDQKINLTAGMSVSAEIKTGKRKVISYLLSPLQSTLDESFRER